jgi:trigger factor
MEPNQFIEQVASSGQVAFYADELKRRKAVDLLVAQAEITDTKGAKVKYEV